MNKENSDKLFDEFKDWFNRDNEMVSLMCFGFECGDGWFDLIYRLCKDIKEIITADGIKNFQVVQVKEKFGGLRFYISGGNDAICDLIDRAEKISYHTCEICGSSNAICGPIKGMGSWVHTQCEPCQIKSVEEREKNLKKWKTKQALKKIVEITEEYGGYDELETPDAPSD